MQVASALLANAHLPGFFKGTIYRGPFKAACVPVLNCYSCPGALGACPVGALQSQAGSPLGVVSFYVLGFLALVGLVVGRLMCGFFCPFGLLQELLHKIPGKKPPETGLTRKLRYLKYGVLAVLVVGIPVGTALAGGVATPAFCKYLCPAGTLEAGIPLLLTNPGLQRTVGWLFGWKLGILLLVLLWCAVRHRAFCRFLCPLGAVYGLFNRFSIVHISLDAGRCTHCGACMAACKLNAPTPDSPECIRCGECITTCPSSALRWKAGRRDVYTSFFERNLCDEEHKP